MSEPKTMNLEITVDDGSVKVPIKNLFGDEIGEFRFRPTDLGMIDRFNTMAERFDKVAEPLESANISNDGTGEDDASIAALQEATRRLYEACDTLFGGNMSAAFFGRMHPFSPVDGRFYCEQVLEQVGAFIGKQFDAQVKKVNARVSRYTHGIKTGKHAGGKK